VSVSTNIGVGFQTVREEAAGVRGLSTEHLAVVRSPIEPPKAVAQEVAWQDQERAPKNRDGLELVGAAAMVQVRPELETIGERRRLSYAP
jgi:hypothetical protein